MSVAQLVGVFVVLSNMMFSGSALPYLSRVSPSTPHSPLPSAQPTLSDLKNNPLLPSIMFYPSFASYFRWSIELFYVTEVTQYAYSVGTLTYLFGYDPFETERCWYYLAFFAVLFRLATYVSLLTKEQ